MALFDVPIRHDKQQTAVLVRKIKHNKVRTSVSENKLSEIVSQVSNKLSKHTDDYTVIRNKDELKLYINKAVDNGIISIDTETTGLDPMIDKIVGLCLYTPGEKATYIPINHISKFTRCRLDEQLNEADINECLQMLIEHRVRIVMFNAAFDIRVLKNQVGIRLHCDFDCYIAGKCLNENEPDSGLKALHNKYCLDGAGDAWSFGNLFSGVSFDIVPINTAYLYAARDAEITYELYQYQNPFLDADDDKCKDYGLVDVSWVFHNIEMPCIDVLVDMEDAGVCFDFTRQLELSDKYNKLLSEKEDACQQIILGYADKIDEYKRTHINHKLGNPININSVAQLAILLYDIIGVSAVDNVHPRGTGEAILAKIDLPLCEAVLEYRAFKKLITTYIDKLPNCVNPNDGRIHCNYNQYGAVTGRLSSSEPNLQNIPSHNKDIRTMFRAKDGYYLLSSDYSQQEPKALAAMCAKSGDTQLLDTFIAGKDLYSEIASVSFGYPYEDCKEFNTDGTTNKEGKARRTQAKSILLGILYGRGIDSIAEQLHCSRDKAQSIKNKVFTGFPAIKEFERASIRMAEEKGYVTTVCGRKRRLPDMQLPEYEFSYTEAKQLATMDVLDFSSDAVIDEVPDDVINSYWDRLDAVRYRSQKKLIIEDALKHGIKIRDNGGFIAEAKRQCVNSRIQGSAADITKLAMIRLHENERLKELGFVMLISVHDEIIAECPKDNIAECKKLFADEMCAVAEEVLGMPISCDVTVTECWYGEEINI